MTEQDWAGSSLLPLLEFLKGTASGRQFRLFACACARRIWDLFPDPSHRALVAAVERHPDGPCGDSALHAAIVASSVGEARFSGDSAYWVVKYLARSFSQLAPAEVALYVASAVAARRRKESGTDAEPEVQVAVLRDIIGNPFRPVALDPAWLTSDARLLARGIYDDRAFDRMPILADALQDAGCDNADVLAHCRAPGEHVCGCWVVDRVLGNG